MSAAVRKRPDRLIELGSTMNWPVIRAAIGLGVGVVTAAVCLILLSGRSAPHPETEATFTVPAGARLQMRAETVSVPKVKPAAPLSETLLHPTPPRALVNDTVAEAPEMIPPPKELVVKSAPTQATALPPRVEVAATPAVVGQAETAAVPFVSPFKRLQQASESDLDTRLVRDVPEIDLEKEKGTNAELLKTKKLPELVSKRDDLKGLPLRNESECRVDEKEAKSMRQLSVALRGVIERRRQKALRPRQDKEDPVQELARLHAQMRDEAAKSKLSSLSSFLEEETGIAGLGEDVGVRLLLQMLQAEELAVRQQLLKILAETKGKPATEALAQRAVFDLSARLREQAIEALKHRPPADYSPVLLAALRYPWPVAADHAAEALVALDDRDAICQLVPLLDQPDPQAPHQNKDKKWMVAELVRVNHLASCLLCHAPSTSRTDSVRGLIPQRDRPLPIRVYYDSRDGSFVRADVTYLKQDFSVTQPVAEPGKWPKMQRFDFLIRQRELSPDEVARLAAARKAAAGQPTSYPQREAVLWALRQLTGQDWGNRSEDWRLWEQDRWQD